MLIGFPRAFKIHFWSPVTLDPLGEVKQRSKEVVVVSLVRSGVIENGLGLKKKMGGGGG